MSKKKNKKIKKGNWAIVASALPAKYLYLNCEKDNLEKIVVSSPFLLDVYSGLQKNDPRVKVVLAPQGRISSIIYYVVILGMIKTTQRKLFIFHECCMPFLDLLIKVIKPRGYYIPQVTLSGSKEVEPDQVKDQRIVQLLSKLMLDRFFSFYEVPPVGDFSRRCLVAVRQYPSTIILKNFHDRSLRPLYGNESLGKVKSVLLLVGQSYVPNEVLLDFYNNIINSVVERGFRCYVKDHPNPKHRINILNDNVETIDPAQPAELLSNQYTIVAGLSSTALLAFGERAVSFVRVVPQMPASKIPLCEMHFSSINKNHEIHIVDSLDEWEALLSNVN